MAVRKTVSIISLGCFLFSFVLGETVQAAVEGVMQARKFKELVDGFAVPPSVGRITEGAYRGSGKVVVNIQDLHCHPEVQRNISRILALLDEKYTIGKVYVEGATGPVDTSWLGGIGDRELKKEIVETLVDQGKLTGTEHYAILYGRGEVLRGMEEEGPYRENLLRLSRILEKQDLLGRKAKVLKKDLEEMKKRYFNRNNRRLERIISEYNSGKIEAGKYYKLLFKFADKIGKNSYDEKSIGRIEAKNFKDINAYLSLAESGRRLRYGDIARQLQEFTGVLKQKLPYSAYNFLLERTDNFRQLDQLYVYLARLSGEYGLDLRRNYPRLQEFFTYLEQSRAINPLGLLKEEKKLIEEIRTGLSEDIGEMEVSFLCDFFGYFEDYLNNRLSAEDYEHFKERIGEFRLLWQKHAPGRLEELEDDFKVLDTFYEVNVRRNEYFIKAIIPAPGGRKEEPESGKSSGDLSWAERALSETGDLTVVVTGGFHTRGLEKLLAERGVTHLTLTPNVTGDTKRSNAVYQELAKHQAKIIAQALALRLLSQLDRDEKLASFFEAGLLGEGRENPRLFAERELERLLRGGKSPDEVRGAMSGLVARWNAYLGKELGTFELLTCDLRGEAAGEPYFFITLKALGDDGSRSRVLVGRYFPEKGRMEMLDGDGEPAAKAPASVGKGIIPGIKKAILARVPLSEELYDDFVGPVIEELLFSGIPFALSLLVPFSAFLTVPLARYVFVSVHGGREGRGALERFALPAFISVLAVAALLISPAAWPVLAIIGHIGVNRFVQPFLNSLFAAMEINLRLLKGVIPATAPSPGITFRAQPAMHGMTDRSYRAGPELVERVRGASMYGTVPQMLEDEYRGLQYDAVTSEETGLLDEKRSELLRKLLAPPGDDAKAIRKLRSMMRILAPWVAKVKEAKKSFHRVYLARDAGFFHSIDGALGRDAGDGGSSVYYLSTPRLTTDIHKAMSMLIADILRSEQRPKTLTGFYEALRIKFRDAYRADRERLLNERPLSGESRPGPAGQPGFSRIVDEVMNELADLGYFDFDKERIILVDTGFRGTMPLFLKNVLDLGNVDSKLKAGGEERVQIALLEPSEIREYEKELFGFDLGMFDEREQAVIRDLARNFDSTFEDGKTLGYQIEESVKAHPVMFDTGTQEIRPAAPAARLEAYLEKIIAVQMALAYRRGENGVEDVASVAPLPAYVAGGFIGKYRVVGAPRLDGERKTLSLRVVDPSGDGNEVVLANVEEMPGTGLRNINASFNSAKPHPLVSRIRSAFLAEVGRGAKLLVFDGPADIGGFATGNLICVNRAFMENPVAWFHEAVEFLAARGRLSAEEIIDMLDETHHEWYKRHTAQLPGFEMHYAIRALQRQLFGARDRAFTYQLRGGLSDAEIAAAARSAGVEPSAALRNFIVWRESRPKDIPREEERAGLEAVLRERAAAEAEERRIREQARQRAEQRETIARIIDAVNGRIPVALDLDAQKRFEESQDELLSVLRGLNGQDPDLAAEMLLRHLIKLKRAGTPSLPFSRYRETLRLIIAAIDGGQAAALILAAYRTITAEETALAEKSGYIALLADLLEAAGSLEGDVLREIIDVLVADMHAVFYGRVRVSRDALEDIADAHGAFKIDRLFEYDSDDKKALYFENDFLENLVDIKNTGLMNALRRLYNEAHYRRWLVRDVLASLLKKRGEADTPAAYDLVYRRLLGELQRSDSTTDVKAMIVSVLAGNWDPGRLAGSEAAFLEQALAVYELTGRDDLRASVGAGILRFLENVSTLEGKRRIASTMKQSTAQLVAEIERVRQEISSLRLQRGDEAARELSRRVDRETRLVNLLSVQIEILVSLSALPSRGSNAEEYGFARDLLEFLVNVAAGDTWGRDASSDIISSVSRHFASFFDSELRETVIPVFLDHIPHDLSVAFEADKIFRGIYPRDEIPSAILQVLQQLEPGSRLGYMLILMFAGDTALLRDIVFGKEIDGKQVTAGGRYRLYAAAHLVASSGRTVPADEIDRIASAVAADAEVEVNALLADAGPRLVTLVDDVWLQNEEAKVYAAAALILLRKGLSPLSPAAAAQLMEAATKVKIIPYWNNARMGIRAKELQIGGRLIKEDLSPLTFLQVIAHELGHGMLYYEHGIYPERLRESTLHEFVADLWALALAQAAGRGTEEYRKALNFLGNLTDVQNNRYKSFEAHEAARALLSLFVQGYDELAAQRPGLPKEPDWQRLLGITLEAINRPENAEVSIAQMVKEQIFPRYFGSGNVPRAVANMDLKAVVRPSEKMAPEKKPFGRDYDFSDIAEEDLRLSLPDVAEIKSGIPLGSVLGREYARTAALWEWLYGVPFLNFLVRPLLSRIVPARADRAGESRAANIAAFAASALFAASLLSGAGWAIALAGLAWSLAGGAAFAAAHRWAGTGQKAALAALGALFAALTIAPLGVFAAGILLPGAGAAGVILAAAGGIGLNIAVHAAYNFLVLAAQRRGLLPANVPVASLLVRRTPAGEGKGYSLQRLINIMGQLPEKAREALTEETYRSTDLDKILDRYPVASETDINTYLGEQAPDLKQAMVELISNAQDASIKESKKIGRFGVGALQVFGELLDPEAGDGDTIVLETSKGGGRGVRFTFFRVAGKIRFDYELREGPAIERGTRIRVNRKITDVEERRRLIEGKFRINTRSALYWGDGTRINRPERYGYVNEQPRPAVPPESEAGPVTVRLDGDGYEIVDRGAGMSIKDVFERFLIPKVTDKDLKGETRQEMEREVKVFYLAGQNTAPEVVLSLSGVVIKALSFNDRVNIVSEMALEFPHDTLISEARETIRLNAQSRVAVEGMKLIIDKLTTRPNIADRFALINTLAALLREIQLKEDKGLGLTRGDPATATDLLWYLNHQLNKKGGLVDSLSDKVVFVPNTPAWAPFLGREDSVILLDEALLPAGGGHKTLGAVAEDVPEEETLFSDVRRRHPGVNIYVADFGGDRRTTFIRDVVGGREVMVVNGRLYREAKKSLSEGTKEEEILLLRLLSEAEGSPAARATIAPSERRKRDGGGFFSLAARLAGALGAAREKVSFLLPVAGVALAAGVLILVAPAVAQAVQSFSWPTLSMPQLALPQTGRGPGILPAIGGDIVALVGAGILLVSAFLAVHGGVFRGRTASQIIHEIFGAARLMPAYSYGSAAAKFRPEDGFMCRTEPSEERYGDAGDRKKNKYGSVHGARSRSPLVQQVYDVLGSDGQLTRNPRLLFAHGGKTTGRKRIMMEVDVTPGQELSVFQLLDGRISELRVYDEKGQELECSVKGSSVVNPDGSVLRDPNIVISVNHSGKVRIEYAIDMYKENEIVNSWQDLPAQELKHLPEQWRVQLDAVKDGSDGERIAAIERILASDFVYDGAATLEYDGVSWTHTADGLLNKGEKIPIICNTSSLYYLILARYAGIPAVYLNVENTRFNNLYIDLVGHAQTAVKVNGRWEVKETTKIMPLRRSADSWQRWDVHVEPTGIRALLAQGMSLAEEAVSGLKEAGARGRAAGRLLATEWYRRKMAGLLSETFFVPQISLLGQSLRHGTGERSNRSFSLPWGMATLYLHDGKIDNILLDRLDGSRELISPRYQGKRLEFDRRNWFTVGNFLYLIGKIGEQQFVAIAGAEGWQVVPLPIAHIAQSEQIGGKVYLSDSGSLVCLEQGMVREVARATRKEAADERHRIDMFRIDDTRLGIAVIDEVPGRQNVTMTVEDERGRVVKDAAWSFGVKDAGLSRLEAMMENGRLCILASFGFLSHVIADDTGASFPFENAGGLEFWRMPSPTKAVYLEQAEDRSGLVRHTLLAAADGGPQRDIRIDYPGEHHRESFTTAKNTYHLFSGREGFISDVPGPLSSSALYLGQTGDGKHIIQDKERGQILVMNQDDVIEETFSPSPEFSEEHRERMRNLFVPSSRAMRRNFRQIHHDGRYYLYFFDFYDHSYILAMDRQGYRFVDLPPLKLLYAQATGRGISLSTVIAELLGTPEGTFTGWDDSAFDSRPPLQQAGDAVVRKEYGEQGEYEETINGIPIVPNADRGAAARLRRNVRGARADLAYLRRLDATGRKEFAFRFFNMTRWALAFLFMDRWADYYAPGIGEDIVRRCNELVKGSIDKSDRQEWLRQVLGFVGRLYVLQVPDADAVAARYLDIAENEKYADFEKTLREQLSKEWSTGAAAGTLEGIKFLNLKESDRKGLPTSLQFFIEYLTRGTRDMLPEGTPESLPQQPGESIAPQQGSESLSKLVAVARLLSGLKERGLAALRRQLENDTNHYDTMQASLNGAVNNQPRDYPVWLRELVQNSRNALRRDIRGGIRDRDIRIESYTHENRWIVSVSDKVGMDLDIIMKYLLNPDATTNRLQDDIVSVLELALPADEELSTLLDVCFEAEARNDTALAGELKELLARRGTEEAAMRRLADEIVARAGKRMKKLTSGYFGQGFFTVFGDADEVFIRTGKDGKVYELEIRPERDPRSGVITDLRLSEMREYADSDGRYRGTEVRRAKYFDAKEFAGVQMENSYLHFVAGKLLGAVNDYRVLWNGEPLADVVEQAGEEGGIRAYVDSAGTGKVTVDGLYVQDVPDELLALVPRQAAHALTDAGVSFDFGPKTPVVRTRSAIRNPSTYRNQAALLSLRAAALLYRQGKLHLPGLLPYRQYLTTHPFKDGLPGWMADDAAFIASGRYREGHPQYRREDAERFWRRYAETYAGDRENWQKLMLMVSLNGEREQLHFGSLPAGMRTHLERLRAAAAGNSILYRDLDAGESPGSLARLSLLNHLVLFAELFLQEQLTLSRMSFEDYLRTGTPPEADAAARRIAENINRGGREALDEVNEANWETVAMHLVLPGRGVSARQLRDSVRTGEGATVSPALKRPGDFAGHPTVAALAYLFGRFAAIDGGMKEGVIAAAAVTVDLKEAALALRSFAEKNEVRALSELFLNAAYPHAGERKAAFYDKWLWSSARKADMRDALYAQSGGEEEFRKSVNALVAELQPVGYRLAVPVPLRRESGRPADGRREAEEAKMPVEAEQADARPEPSAAGTRRGLPAAAQFFEVLNGVNLLTLGALKQVNNLLTAMGNVNPRIVQLRRDFPEMYASTQYWRTDGKQKEAIKRKIAEIRRTAGLNGIVVSSERTVMGERRGADRRNLGRMYLKGTDGKPELVNVWAVVEGITDADLRRDGAGNVTRIDNPVTVVYLETGGKEFADEQLSLGALKAVTMINNDKTAKRKLANLYARWGIPTSGVDVEDMAFPGVIVAEKGDILEGVDGDSLADLSGHAKGKKWEMLTRSAAITRENVLEQETDGVFALFASSMRNKSVEGMEKGFDLILTLLMAGRLLARQEWTQLARVVKAAGGNNVRLKRMPLDESKRREINEMLRYLQSRGVKTHFGSEIKDRAEMAAKAREIANWLTRERGTAAFDGVEIDLSAVKDLGAHELVTWLNKIGNGSPGALLTVVLPGNLKPESQRIKDRLGDNITIAVERTVERGGGAAIEGGAQECVKINIMDVAVAGDLARYIKSIRAGLVEILLSDAAGVSREEAESDSFLAWLGQVAEGKYRNNIGLITAFMAQNPETSYRIAWRYGIEDIPGEDAMAEFARILGSGRVSGYVRGETTLEGLVKGMSDGEVRELGAAAGKAVSGKGPVQERMRGLAAGASQGNRSEAAKLVRFMAGIAERMLVKAALERMGKEERSGFLEEWQEREYGRVLLVRMILGGEASIDEYFQRLEEEQPAVAGGGEVYGIEGYMMAKEGERGAATEEMKNYIQKIGKAGELREYLVALRERDALYYGDYLDLLSFGAKRAKELSGRKEDPAALAEYLRILDLLSDLKETLGVEEEMNRVFRTRGVYALLGAA